MLIGKKAYRDREEKGRTIPDKGAQFRRQGSEMHSLYSGWDNSKHESLFVGLQAYMCQK